MNDVATFSQKNILQKIIWVLLAMAFAYGLWRAIAVAWVCDDAFISFRYARNLIDGHGLVFNVGEIVEGYTNFLWTLLMAAGIRAGFEVAVFSQVLGIASYIATVFLSVYLSLRLWRDRQGGSGLILPFTALGILLMRDYHVYGTSGLETALTALLVTAGFSLLVLGEESRSSLWAGLILVLGAMTRPDAMVFYAMGLPYLLLAQEKRWRHAAVYLIPLVVLYLPYWLWRFEYYGYPFPNTYYAKSAHLAYYSQGLVYIWLFFKTYYTLLLAVPAAGIIAWSVVRHWLRAKRLDMLGDRAALAALLFVIPFLVYVARVGGDFMFARFLIPVTPLLLIVIELALLELPRRRFAIEALALLVLAGVGFRSDHFSVPEEGISGIVDERDYYPPSTVEQAQTNGPKIRGYLEGIDVAVGFLGTQAMLVYYSNVPEAVECASGLTDIHLAHQEIAERGRPGHEKTASFDYLSERRVRFMFWRNPPSWGRYDPFRKIKFDNLEAVVIAWDNKVMAHLGQFPQVQFVDFPAFLDWYVGNIATIPASQHAEDLNFFRQFYFDVNDDEPRLKAVITAMQN